MSKFFSVFVALGISASAYAAEPAPGKQLESPNKVTLTQDVTATSATLVCSKGQDDKLLCKPFETGDVEFTTKNLVVLRGVIDSQTASKFVQEFHELEHRDEAQKIYVYVMSPGGSIFAGDYIFNMIRSSKKEVVMVVDFAASMAFHVTEAGTKRLILPTGTLMQHHASGGTGGGREFPNVDKQWDWIKRKVGMMNKQDSAACSKTSYEDFMKNIDRDWWLLSDEAVNAGCADAVANKVTCSKDLMNQKVEQSISFFGMEINLVWSGCPLETYPRSVNFRSQAGSFSSLTEKQRQLADQYIQLITDPLQYYHTHGSFNYELFGDDKQGSLPATK